MLKLREAVKLPKAARNAEAARRLDTADWQHLDWYNQSVKYSVAYRAPKPTYVLNELVNQQTYRLTGYRWFWVADDNIDFTHLDVSRYTSLAAESGASIVQPAVEFDSEGIPSHEIVLAYTGAVQLPNHGWSHSLYRYTDFVEVMSPMFSVEALRAAWKLYIPGLRSDFGMDQVWCRYVASQLSSPSDRTCAIIDAEHMLGSSGPSHPISSFASLLSMAPSEEGGGVFPRKQKGEVWHWHVRFPGASHTDFVVSVGKDEREFADTLLGILRSLEPKMHGDNAELRRLCRERLKQLRRNGREADSPEAAASSSAVVGASAGSKAAEPEESMSKIELECEVCFEEFNDSTRAPFLSRCGHTFCQSCMKELIGQRNTYDCPTCRKTFASNECTKNFWIIQNLPALLQRKAASPASTPKLGRPKAAEAERSPPMKKSRKQNRQLEATNPSSSQLFCGSRSTDQTSLDPRPAAVELPPSSQALPPGWEQAIDTQSGDSYFFNKYQQVTWERPESLPAGWEQAIDAQSGDSYFFNKYQQVTWERPQSLPPGWEQAIDPQSGDSYFFNKYQHVTWERPQSLPPGWEQAMHPNSGETYYFHSSTHETRWERPA
ncbi:ITCH [Symbiodinium sp. CCMP2592]|nr:ITCH [Symbiodinium sp. CCMP2592]